MGSMEFSDRVKNIRKQLKLSQAEFAKGIGVARTTLSRWENGKFKPNYEAVKRFEEYCLIRKTDDRRG